MKVPSATIDRPNIIIPNNILALQDIAITAVIANITPVIKRINPIILSIVSLLFFIIQSSEFKHTFLTDLLFIIRFINAQTSFLILNKAHSLFC